MGLFKNEVGRPSNETIRSRRTLVLVLVLVGVALVGGLTFYVTKSLKKSDEISGTGKNAVAPTAPYTGDVATAPNYTKSDGKITQEDADAILKFSVGSLKPTTAQKKNADIDGDGKITSSDARLATRVASGYGDIDRNGTVNSADARLLSRYISGLENFNATQKSYADIDGDGKVNSTDSRLMSRITVKYGDVATATNTTKGDGYVTKEDADLILKFAVQLKTPTSAQKLAADMDKDGDITAADARLALRKSGKTTGLMGDVATAPNYTKSDGKITQDDADAILKFSVGSLKPTTAQNKNADIDGDGKVTSADARLATRVASGYGDIDRDGKVTSADARLLSRYNSGLEKFNATQKKFADIDGDGKINSTDSRLMSRITVNYGDVATAPNYTKADGVLTQADADAILKFAVGSLKPNSTQKAVADMDGDGKITSSDARLVARAID